MSDDDPLDAEPFSFFETKSGIVQIRFKGKVVTSLAGRNASRFMERIRSASKEDAQLAMAKATGHFKHGNERSSKRRSH